MGMAALMEILTHQVKDKQVKVRVILVIYPKLSKLKKISFTWVMCIYYRFIFACKTKIVCTHKKYRHRCTHINVPTQMYLHIHTDIDTYITPLLHLHLLNFLHQNLWKSIGCEALK